jgi:AraC-like DNA-binding protein
MASSTPLIRSSLLSEFPQLIRDLGGSPDEVLEMAGLSLEQIEQPALLIPFDKQIQLLQISAQRYRTEDLGLQLARRQDMAVFGALSLLAMQCKTVQQGLQLFGRYLHYSVQAVDLKMEVKNDLAYFIIDTPYETAAQSHQFWDHGLAMACTVTRMLCGANWAPRSTYLRRPAPEDAGPYNRYFRSPVAFGGDLSALVYPLDTLMQPISTSINSVPHQLQQYLRTSFEGDFLEQMRRVINSLLVTRDCTEKTVADCMGYSLRTLQRKLHSEGTSFQQQIDKERSALAISYLQEPQFSLTDISELLGYAEPSVFTRSFKRWFGVTPSQWRARKFT